MSNPEWMRMFLCLALLHEGCQAATTSLLSPAQQGQCLEMRLYDVPHAGNPFDPEAIRLDAVFQTPSGLEHRVPAFWFQDFSRTLQDGREQLTPKGAPEWRIRYLPLEAGLYQMRISLAQSTGTNNALLATNWIVSAVDPNPNSHGFIRCAPSQQYLEAAGGRPLKLIGANVCWPGSRGTFDYDDWFTSMASAGENFARLWMSPWALGIEAEPGTLTQYRLDRAWQLDYVFALAEMKGIALMLCLDYHGMFETEEDYWGGNNRWPKNPYNQALGGPCASQNAFFSSTRAQEIYQKRLRYLIGRWGYSPRLLAWEFFNEIDNVYQYLNATDVEHWHANMGDWLRAHDPYHHIITTSLTGGSDRPGLWSLPQLDLVQYHSYGLDQPSVNLAAITRSMQQRYQKPVLIVEYGVDWQGWSRSKDPFLRGFRQGIWGGALGGSAGSSMPWYWENIHSENLYPYFDAMRRILERTGWGQGSWMALDMQSAGLPPTNVAELLPGAPSFDIILPLNSQWGSKLRGQLAIASESAAAYSASVFNSFVHGSSHPDLRIPFRLEAWLDENARLILHLNSVSSGAILSVRANQKNLLSQNLANLDGTYQVNHEYDRDIVVNLPSGKQVTEIRNTGGDWFYLDWIRLEKVRPSHYLPDWQPAPGAIGLARLDQALLYVVHPLLLYPANATNQSLPVWNGGSIVITNWSRSQCRVECYNPRNAQLATNYLIAGTSNCLTVPLPSLEEDLVVRLISECRLANPRQDPKGTFALDLECDPGLQPIIEASTNLQEWWDAGSAVPQPPGLVFRDPAMTDVKARFYRARIPD